MAFDPKEYLARTAPQVASTSGGFDPVAYLQARPISTGNMINSDVPTVVGEVPNPPEIRRKFTAAEKAKAVLEVPATMLSGAALAVPSAISALATGEGPMAMAERNMYQPRSPASQEALQTIGSVFEATKLPPVMPSGMLPSYANMVGQSGPNVRSAANVAGQNVNKLAEAVRRPPEPTLSGVGAAEVDPAIGRINRARNLRVPVQLTKGQATKDLGEQQFEIETAKTYPQDVGRPIIDTKLDQNQRILANFDAYLEPIGSKVAAPMNLREVGKVVDAALVKRTQEAKKQISESYKAAREAGELQEMIDVTPVKTYLEGLEAEAINAPIITSAKMKLDAIAPKGQVSINDLEEVRKMVGQLSGSTPTNQLFGKEINKLIDSTTENRGGELYKAARKLRSDYAREFENVGVVDKLLSTKGNSSDRAVAFEKVFDHAILNGSLDDVKAIGATLKRSGPEGEQAFRELVGQTIEYMREAITKNSRRDANDLPIVSPAQFNTVVNNLDKSGKLDYLFGKRGAQEIRDLRDTTLDVYTNQEGINVSNTSSALNQILGRAIKSKIPLIGPVLDVGAEYLDKKKISKQVGESVNYSPERAAKLLREK